ncbi:unnamed protein product [Lactuca virosa]|uniref:Uncharacterized protein n=1 Tax=Lactuca virosa TaxID=75947 RepID=A0AAU9LEW3_9ASTR|nr:unnamed protein product [Lactuca virosa]
MAGGKETGGAPFKRVESLEKELGHLYNRMDTQGHQIRNHADSLASMNIKMDQKFEEILSAIIKGKKTGEDLVADKPIFSVLETPKGPPKEYNGGSRQGTMGGSGGNRDGGG